jgi:ribosomal protein S18 acetylase RimI-like enzyme
MSDLQVVVKRVQAEDAQLAYCCMTEVPTPWPEALCLCRGWIAENLGRYAEGYHAQLSHGEVIGHVYYAASDRALFPYEVEPGAAVMYCEWVQRRYQGQGVGRRLFDALAAELREQNCHGLLVEGTDLEGQMNYRHYLARGFQVIYESGHRKLLYFPLGKPHVQARPLQPGITPKSGLPIEILILSGYLCPLDVSTQISLLEVAHEFGNQVVLRQELLTPETLRRYGAANGVFINGRQKLTGGATEEAIRQAIVEEM